MRTSSLLIIVLFAACVADLGAQKLSIETLIDTNVIVLGDQIHLNYSIEKQKSIRIILPEFTDTITGNIEIIGSPDVDSSYSENDLQRIIIDLTITSFDTGFYIIPPQPFIFTDNNVSDTLMSRATYLMVIGVPLDTALTVRDIRPIERMPLTKGEITTYFTIFLGAAGIILLIIYLIIYRKRKKPLFKPLKPEEPAHITAFRELDKLKAMKLWQQKQVKEYYTRITYIIRWYIEKRFRIPALEQTTYEILRNLGDLKVKEYSTLENLLNLADLVKFAKGEPDPEENMLHLDNAYEFIKNTKEVKTTEEPQTISNEKSEK